jgi:E3 ubiquitin-protein ligase UBR7
VVIEEPITNGENQGQAAIEEVPLPAGFPEEDDFDHLICYKCVNSFPWIKQYAGTTGFLPAIPADGSTSQAPCVVTTTGSEATSAGANKRKAEEEVEEFPQGNKKPKSELEDVTEIPGPNETGEACPAKPRHQTLPAAPTRPFSLFLQEDFRDHFCRCADCFPRLAKHRQLLEAEEAYEPPVSESNHDENASVGGRSVNSGSLLDRGEAALSSMDRVRAIEGVMAYNHVRDKVKAFLAPFAESGQPVGAEDIKAYFAKLRGDEAAVRDAAVGASSTGAAQGDGRKEQDGY